MPNLQYKLFSGIISKFPPKLKIQVLYFKRFNKFCSFLNPVTFNEKLQVRKIKDRDKLLPIAADKIRSKELVQKLTTKLYIPKTIWSGSSVESINSIDFEKLPYDYVFKANHTSQTIKIIRNKKHLSLSKMKKLTKSWLKHDQSLSLGEWAYQDIPKCVFIEEFLDFNNTAPDDYKFFVYHGKVKFIQLDSDRFSNHKRNMYNANWIDLKFNFSHMRKIPSPAKPNFLNDMIKISEEIGQHFDFIRVDLYFYKNMVTFGELTVYPGAGFEKFPEYVWDVEFGKHWNQKYL